MQPVIKALFISSRPADHEPSKTCLLYTSDAADE